MKSTATRAWKRRATLAGAAGLATLAIALGSPPSAGAAEARAGLPRSSPEAQGVASSGVLAFVNAADAQIDQMNSFMLVRHGHVVAEGWWAPYAASQPHMLYSLTKSFTSTAVGLAVSEGRMSVDDTVLQYFPDDAPPAPSDNLKAMRVADLLRMSTGQQAEAPRTGTEWVKAFLAQPVPFKPGTHFLYNTPASYMLSAIVQKATGSKVADYLRSRLFEPLGIEHPPWETSPEGVTIGGYGLSVRTEDIARFGQLYLQKGSWNGRQILPASWVETATARQTANGSNPSSDWDQGYGYQFWRCRHGFYRGDGAFGQYCIVMPQEDAVVAITSGVKSMQAVMDLVWEKLPSAMHERPLPADEKARVALARRLASLSVPSVSGLPFSPVAATVSGKSYSFAANDAHLESIVLETKAEGGEATLVARIDGTEQTIPCRFNAFGQGRITYGFLGEQPVATSGAWTADDTYRAKICFYQTPYYLTLTLRFGDDRVTLDSEWNVAFGPTKQPTLVGTTSASAP
jgi:CubicO group peptidase (beta-lactamase class C family)